MLLLLRLSFPLSYLLFLHRSSEMKPTGSQNDTGDLIMLKKKLKMKKRRLKEEMQQWEESKRCPDAETEAAEPPSKKRMREREGVNTESTGM